MDALFEKWNLSLTQCYYLATKYVIQRQLVYFLLLFSLFSKKAFIRLYKEANTTEIVGAEKITNNVPINNFRF